MGQDVQGEVCDPIPRGGCLESIASESRDYVRPNTEPFYHDLPVQRLKNPSLIFMQVLPSSRMPGLGIPNRTYLSKLDRKT